MNTFSLKKVMIISVGPFFITSGLFCWFFKGMYLSIIICLSFVFVILACFLFQFSLFSLFVTVYNTYQLLNSVVITQNVRTDMPAQERFDMLYIV